jgi:signal transduction histidine kinase
MNPPIPSITTRVPPSPPWEALRASLLARADALEEAGLGRDAKKLRETVDDWWAQQTEWNNRLLQILRVHHEINNALVGVSGNVQLLLMGPGREPGIRERLEVVLRETGRIGEAANQLRQLRAILGAAAPPEH